MLNVDALLILADYRLDNELDGLEKRFEARCGRRLDSRMRSVWGLVVLWCLCIAFFAEPNPSTTPGRIWLLFELCFALAVPWLVWFVLVSMYAVDRMRARRTLRLHEARQPARFMVRFGRMTRLALIDMRAGAGVLFTASSAPLFLGIVSHQAWPGSEIMTLFAVAAWIVLLLICVGRIWWAVYVVIFRRYREQQCIACGHPLPTPQHIAAGATPRCSECGTSRRVELAIDRLKRR